MWLAIPIALCALAFVCAFLPAERLDRTEMTSEVDGVPEPLPERSVDVPTSVVIAASAARAARSDRAAAR